jgi:hypothetical protein
VELGETERCRDVLVGEAGRCWSKGGKRCGCRRGREVEGGGGRGSQEV